MQIVLPELDGRLSSTAISFKSEDEREDRLEYARTSHAPDAQGIALAVEQAARWIRLAAQPCGERRIGVVLSDYPAAGQLAHAIGLDTIESGSRSSRCCGKRATTSRRRVFSRSRCRALRRPT